MKIIGLTGGIACGKSNISDTLRELGAAVIDGDILSRELTSPGGPALPDIRKAFGDGVFHHDGTLNRRALGACIFANEEARARLDSIMHPLLIVLIFRRIEEARESGAALCVLDMPLLYEVGLDILCERVWCAYIPEDMQRSRLMARDGFTYEEAEARLRSQMPARVKADRADVVIDTSGSIEDTKALIPALFAAELVPQEHQGGTHDNANPAAPDHPEG